jgi:exodeoxyribonuclease VII small subunit
MRFARACQHKFRPLNRSVRDKRIRHSLQPERLHAQRWFEMATPHPIVVQVEASEAKLTFEAALERLETVVESMESGEVPLAELLAKFEEGTKLLKVCESRLKDAELKIEQLKKQKDGTIAFEKFEAERED